MLSLITPAFNEMENLGPLYDRIVVAMQQLGEAWEWLIVDDHSRDRTFEAIQQLAAHDVRVRGVRLARNMGSHAAISCGLHHVHGDAVVMMAADLQDPPETLGAMLTQWRNGAQIVWAVRRTRPGEPSHAGFASLYYWIMRHVVGMKEMPARGADFFLLDRVVLEAFQRFPEKNVSVLALLTWMGFRQEQIEYDKQPRIAGRSGWTLGRKIGLVTNSVVSFSSLPIRLTAYGGGALLIVSLILFLALPGVPADAWWPMLVMAAVVALAAIQLLAIGIVGEYVWRTLDEARGRPPYLIEAAVGVDSARADRVSGAAVRPC